MKQKFINLTPHQVDMYFKGEVIASFPSEGSVRLVEDDFDIHYAIPEGVESQPEIKIARRRYTKGNLPDYQPNTYLIVSQIVAQAYPMRGDLVYPSGDIRNEKGQVIGATALCQVP